MTRLLIILGACGTAIGAFWTLLTKFGRSQKALGKSTVVIETQARTLDDVATAQRIQQNLDGLSPDERRRRLQDNFSRDE